MRCRPAATKVFLVGTALAQPLSSRLDIHDRKQFEMKLEYQPAPKADSSRYLVETFFFLPASLNIDQDTYPRASFYTDIHNYIRLKTPVMGFPEMLSDANSPLVKLERRLESGRLEPQSELIHEAKMLSCVFRAALRRFDGSVRDHAQKMGAAAAAPAGDGSGLASEVNVVSTRARPPCPIAFARSRPLSMRINALANVAGLSGSASRPVTPSSSSSGMPPRFDATTGRPLLIASSTTVGHISVSDGNTATAHCRT